MFAGLEIGKSADFKKHLNQYDVIHLDIQWCIEPAGGRKGGFLYFGKDDCGACGILSRCIERETESLPEVLSRINGATGKNLLSSLMNGMSLFVTRTLIKGTGRVY